MWKRGWRRLRIRTTIICAMVTVWTVAAQPVAFTDPIPFHGGQLVNYQKTTEVRIGTRVVRPDEANAVFVTIKLEIQAPFEYRRGMFRELSLIDENGRIYQYKGLLMDAGWSRIDDAKEVKPGDVMLTFSADAYPKQLDIHFEVPAAVNKLSLRVGNRTQTLFSSPG